MTKITAVYDNGGKTFDRYSIYTDEVEKRSGGHVFYAVLGCSNNPTHPRGFSQWSSGVLGPHNGKRIPFSALPKHIQAHVRSRIPGARVRKAPAKRGRTR